jgi:hypothetical protein
MRSWRLAAGFANGKFGVTPLTIDVIDKSNYENLSSTTLTLTLPSSIQAGDLLLASIMYRGTITVPTGWESVASSRALYGTDTYVSTHLFKRRAVAGDAGTTVQFVDATYTPNRMAGLVTVLRGNKYLDVLSSNTNKTENAGTGSWAAPQMTPSPGQVVLSAASTYLQSSDAGPYYMLVDAGFVLDTPPNNTDAGNQIRMGVAHSFSGNPAANFSIVIGINPTNSWSALSALIGEGTPPVSNIFYFNDFEADTHGFSGAWARTTKWAKAGAYSYGSTNQGVQSNDQPTVLALDLPNAAVLSFDGYVEGEPSTDGLIVNVNGALWRLPDIQFVGPSGTFTDTTGLLATATAPAVGVTFKYTKLVPAGPFSLRLINHKDGSVDAGLDGSFVDNLKIEKYSSTPPANPYFFWDFEDGTPGFTGTWAPSSEWAISGKQSLGRTNKGVVNSVTSASLSVSVPGPAIVEFYFYTQGEGNYDGIGVTLNSLGLQSADIAVIDGSYTLNTTSNLLTSGGGFWGKFSRRVPAGTVNLQLTYTKDQSGDVGIDGAFIDQLSIYPYVAPVVAQNLPLTSNGNNTTGSPDYYEIQDTGYTMTVKQNASVGWWKAGSQAPRTSNTGKWYYEAVVKSILDATQYGGGTALGIQASQESLDIGAPWGTGTRIGYHADGTTRVAGTYRAYGARYEAGDVIGIGYDSDAATVHAWKNGVYQGQIGTLAELGIGSGGASMIPAMGLYYPVSINLPRTAQYLPDGWKIWA